MKRQKFYMAGLFTFMVCFGFFVAGCSGGGLGDVNVHFATQGQGDNLMTADQEIYYGPMMGDTFDKSKPPREGTLGPFPNTKWQILSVVPKPKTPFSSMYLAFQPDGTLIMTTESPGGKISTSVHKYSVVGDSMLLSKPGSSTNVRYRVDGSTMHVDTGRASIVLEKVN